MSGFPPAQPVPWERLGLSRNPVSPAWGPTRVPSAGQSPARSPPSPAAWHHFPVPSHACQPTSHSPRTCLSPTWPCSGHPLPSSGESFISTRPQPCPGPPPCWVHPWPPTAQPQPHSAPFVPAEQPFQVRSAAQGPSSPLPEKIVKVEGTPQIIHWELGSEPAKASPTTQGRPTLARGQRPRGLLCLSPAHPDHRRSPCLGCTFFLAHSLCGLSIGGALHGKAGTGWVRLTCLWAAAPRWT